MYIVLGYITIGISFFTLGRSFIFEMIEEMLRYDPDNERVNLPKRQQEEHLWAEKLLRKIFRVIAFLLVVLFWPIIVIVGLIKN